MTDARQKQLGATLWKIADQLRGAMNADDFRDYMLSFLFLRYLSDNYEVAAEKELGKDYPKLNEDDRRTPLSVWYEANKEDTAVFEKQMRRKVHYIIKPEYLWSSIYELARTQSDDLLKTLQAGFKHVENDYVWVEEIQVNNEDLKNKDSETYSVKFYDETIAP